MLVVLAPDKFKGSLTAAEVVDALTSGLVAANPDIQVRRAPVADGGDGTVDAFVAAGWDRVGAYAMRGQTAVIELAAVCGLAGMERLDPRGASSWELGVAIGTALDRGAREIILGLGGSASTDGGSGMLSALGARVRDAAGRDLPRGGAALTQVEEVDMTSLRPELAGTQFTLACDVANPLLGPDGAAAVYGPQKGAGPDDIAVLEAGLTRWAQAVGPEFAPRPGAGAAGGVGFGAMAVLGAQRRPGIEVVLEATRFAESLIGADVVITGEGSLDEQSLQGKAPMGVLAAARAAGIPVVVVAGRSALSPEQCAAAGFAGLYTLAELEPDPARSMANAAELVREIGRFVADAND